MPASRRQHRAREDAEQRAAAPHGAPSTRRRRDQPAVLERRGGRSRPVRAPHRSDRGDHPVAVDRRHTQLWATEGGRLRGALFEHVPGEVRIPISLSGVAMKRSGGETGRCRATVRPSLSAPREAVRRFATLVVEVAADAVDGQRADRDGERAQDHERQQRRDRGEAHADRQPVEARRQTPDGDPAGRRCYARRT